MPSSRRFPTRSCENPTRSEETRSPSSRWQCDPAITPSRNDSKPREKIQVTTATASDGDTTQNQRLISVVIPVYNEQATIESVLHRVLALPLSLEVIVVDDGSTDGTRASIATFADDSRVHVISKSQNEGKGAALQTGFDHAAGEIIIVQDADLEYDPQDIPRLVQPIIDGTADVVFGSRFLAREPQGSSNVHRFGNAVLTAASNLTTGLGLTDMETCYKAFRRGILQNIRIKQQRFGCEPEITAKVARRRPRLMEMPISYHGRTYEDGKKIGMRDAFNALYCVARYALMD